MKKQQKVILIVLACILMISSVVLAVCFLLPHTAEPLIAKAEKDYSVHYNNYCTYKSDSYMKIDGVLDEAEWKNKKWFTNTWVDYKEGLTPTYQATAFPGEKGVYVAWKVEDANIVYNGQKALSLNSSFEFYICADNVGEPHANDLLYSRRFIVDMGGDVNGVYCNFDRAVVVDGEVNSGNTKGATMEAFIPWETLQIDTSKGIPTEFGMIHYYHGVISGNSGATTCKVHGLREKYTRAYYMFDANGYANQDREGAVVGDTKFGASKAPGWDISKESEGIVQSVNGGSNNCIYFKDVYAKNLMVEATIIPVSNLNDDQGPKAGIEFVNALESYSVVGFNIHESKFSKETGTFNDLVLFTSDNTDGALSRNYSVDAAITASKKQGATLTVLKYGEDFWYFVNGKFAAKETIPNQDKEVYPALFNFAGNAIYKDYSCKEITSKDLTDYLNQKGIYRIEAKPGNGGGTVTASSSSVVKGESVDISIVTKKGYTVSSILINDKEKLSTVKKSAEEGTFRISGITANQIIKVFFEKVDNPSTLNVVAKNEKVFTAKLIVTGITNKLLRYEGVMTPGGNNVIELPSGTYQVQVIADNMKVHTTQVTIKGKKNLSVTLVPSGFLPAVKVNNKTVASAISKFDLTKEAEGKVSTSYAMGGMNTNTGFTKQALYFEQTAKNFVASTTISYTTEFKQGEAYQPDLIAGFYIHDGSNGAMAMIYNRSIRYTGSSGWETKSNVLPHAVLMYPNPVSAKLTLVKYDNMVYFYLDDAYVYEMKFSEFAPKLNAKGEFAVGLCVQANKAFDVEFSGYNLQTGNDAAKKYISEHVLSSKRLSKNSIFAKSILVNNKVVNSNIANYDIKDEAYNVIRGSHELKSKNKTIWFYTEGTTTALMSATIKYTTDFKAGVDYQRDPYGGFRVTDGTNEGYIYACNTFIRYTDWKMLKNVVDEPVFYYAPSEGYDKPRELTMTLALKDGYIYVYYDGVLKTSFRVTAILNGANPNSKLAFGPSMVVDKASDIEFSNISYTEKAADVDKWIASH